MVANCFDSSKHYGSGRRRKVSSFKHKNGTLRININTRHVIALATLGVCLTVLVALLSTFQDAPSVPHLYLEKHSLLESYTWNQVPETVPANENENSRNLSSHLSVLVASSGTGLLNKYFYRFKNAEIRDGSLFVHYDPKQMDPPSEEHWVDIVSCNATSPKLPTMFVIKGNARPVRWHYLPVKYVLSMEPRCTHIIEDPTYLLQVRYSYNIWHTWNEGIMGLFQTLRELGKLPLVSIGSHGELQEITDGMGEIGCPRIYDFKQKRPVQGGICQKKVNLISKGEKCNLLTDSWCKPGTVYSYYRSRPEAPLILTYTRESTLNIWSHLYESISRKQKTFSEVKDTCFLDLIIGKSSTLNFYQTLNRTKPEESVLARVPRVNNTEMRVEAMAVFKAFITSAHREWVSNQKKLDPGSSEWSGYTDTGLELLRKGVGPEHIGQKVASLISMKAVPGSLREESEELQKQNNVHDMAVASVVNEFVERYGSLVPEDEQPANDMTQLFDEEANASLVYRSHYINPNDKEEKSLQRTSDDVQNVRSVTRRSLLSKESKGWFDKDAKFMHEMPRPVVTYMSRNFFSRGVLNEKDILDYVIRNYNVTTKVTTFQEPLLQVMDLLAHSDVLFGMHGAGWTNTLFMKRGATTMQLYPYGWRLPDNSTVRGYNYREIVYASEGKYMEWVNPRRDFSYFRRIDFKKGPNVLFNVHPDPTKPLPNSSWPGNQWIYQNTYIDMGSLSQAIDDMMQRASIPKIS